MDVTVRLFASLRRGRFEERLIGCAPDSTVESIIRDLGIPQDQVSIALVDDKRVDFQHHLSTGSILSLFPLIGGG